MDKRKLLLRQRFKQSQQGTRRKVSDKAWRVRRCRYSSPTSVPLSFLECFHARMEPLIGDACRRKNTNKSYSGGKDISAMHPRATSRRYVHCLPGKACDFLKKRCLKGADSLPDWGKGKLQTHTSWNMPEDNKKGHCIVLLAVLVLVNNTKGTFLLSNYTGFSVSELSRLKN